MNKGDALRQPCCLNNVTRCAIAPAAAVQATCASLVVPVDIEGGDSDLLADVDTLTINLESPRREYNGL